MKGLFKHMPQLCKNARAANPGLSQGDLARQLGYKNEQFISNVERGKCNLPPSKIKQFSQLTGVKTQIIVDTMIADFRESLLDELKRQGVTDDMCAHKVWTPDQWGSPACVDCGALRND